MASVPEPSFPYTPGRIPPGVPSGPNQEPSVPGKGFEYTPYTQPTLNDVYRQANQAKIDAAKAKMQEQAGQDIPGTTTGRRLMSDAYKQSDEQHRQAREEAEAQYQASGHAMRIPESMLPPQHRTPKEQLFAGANARHARIQERAQAIRAEREGQS
jgi:hypothetical protein